jgi:hypothetical protein
LKQKKKSLGAKNGKKSFDAKKLKFNFKIGSGVSFKSWAGIQNTSYDILTIIPKSGGGLK